MIRTFLVDKLEKAGLTPLQASTTGEAWNIIWSKPVDFIVLDIILPQEDGLEFLKSFKKEEKYKNIPVLVLSNLSHESEIARARELGAMDYIVKAEKTPAEIVEKIQSYLTHSS